MPRRHLRLPPLAEPDRSRDVDAAVRRGLAALRAELDVPAAFPAAVTAEARARAAAGPAGDVERADLRDLPLLTIDPPGSMDLDQALHLERRGSGYRVHYAIADVAAWVLPGGAIDTEARARVTTLYAPDGRTPLHPPELSEGAASLLPGQAAPAALWEIDLDEAGTPQSVRVGRATVRSTARLTYDEAQRAIVDRTGPGAGDGALALLREVGDLRVAAERARGGITLPTPEQEVEPVPGGGWRLTSRRTLPVEEWNAQISLLTGMCAADLMLDARVGVLRTLPEAQDGDVDRLRRTALALGVDWPTGTPPGQVLATLDAADPRHAAVLAEATTLLRGAAYVAFDGARPEHPGHGAIAAPYAHVTAPLRRLVDRFTTQVCLAVSAGVEPDEPTRAALPELPALMAAGDRRASAYERGCLDLVEAALLAGREGQELEGVVVDVRDDGSSGILQLADPVVRARVAGTDLVAGTRLRVRLVEADVARRLVRFEEA
ncbi:RNB domain-containing ribonuclease [Cellulomonas sp. DKR-3]|uniref:RNB domain-containing ribonuclease n=1 Tax=Cellulomonas fulva TaxID=2835530 RepID=A0ABS5TW34_9CELL|nr:RNB domain-containing ribonuclease [Cellulomonas fulva]MBT0993312.1 RNB domain-containing ribonuclease [Cellulomonas fulva]